MMRYDYANAKALFKMRLSGNREPEALSALGRIPTEELEEAVEGKDSAALPGHLAAAMDEARQLSLIHISRLVRRTYGRIWRAEFRLFWMGGPAGWAWNRR